MGSHSRLSRTSSFAASETNTPDTTPSEHDMDLWAPKKPSTETPSGDLRRRALDLESLDGSTAPTEAGEEDMKEDEERELKTPRAVSRKLAFVADHSRGGTALSMHGHDDGSLLPASTFSPNSMASGPMAIAAGPMSQLLHTLLGQISSLEKSTPTIMSTEHQQLQDRLSELERDHKRQTTQYLQLVELRAGDLENLIKVRDLLARERRDHTAMIQLRDDDLANVLVLREKLAVANYKISRVGFATSATFSPDPATGGGVVAPPVLGMGGTIGNLSPTTVSTAGARLSMKQSDYLWQVARTAAMEQRVLELETANKELHEQLTRSTTTLSVPALSSALVQSSSSSSSAAAAALTSTSTSSLLADGQLIARIETMFEDSLRQREKTATRMQALRSEKDLLQKQATALEDRNADLEAVVERLQRTLRL